eukprot:752663-Hanusia_phi.AAC.1
MDETPLARLDELQQVRHENAKQKSRARGKRRSTGSHEVPDLHDAGSGNVKSDIVGDRLELGGGNSRVLAVGLEDGIDDLVPHLEALGLSLPTNENISPRGLDVRTE